MAEHFNDTAEPVYGLNVDRPKSERRNLLNPYADGFSFDFFAYVSENETSFENESELVWVQKNLTYGPDSSLLELQTNIRISRVSCFRLT